MWALITGASSGIGYDIAGELAERGYDLILVARREERLKSLAEKLTAEKGVRCEVVPADVSDRVTCEKLYIGMSERGISIEDIEILVNNAGFGVLGEFVENSLERELELIDVNVTALHILTKMFLRGFVKRGGGYILNVASAAGFMSGPKMAAYYASKNYVLSLSAALYEEQRRSKSNVSVSVLCPGPVKTEFSDVANSDFAVVALTSKFVAKKAVKGMLAHKLFIIPGISNKLSIFATRFMPRKLMLRIVYKIQNLKVR